MKIEHLLNESNDKLFERITNTKFFKQNYEEKVRYAVQNDIEFHYMEDIAWLFHGSSKMPRGMGVMTQKYRGGPLDSSSLFHDLVNKYSVEKFDVPVRNLLFCHTIKHKVDEYGGKEYVMFPLSDDYTLYYADSIDDMTNYYRVSKHAKFDVTKKLKKFFDKYGIDEEVPSDLSIVTQDSVEEFEETISNMFKMMDHTFESLSLEELTNRFTKFVLNEYDEKAQDYVSRLNSTQSLFKSGWEMMIQSDQIAYLDAYDRYGSGFANFKQYLYKKYS